MAKRRTSANISSPREVLVRLYTRTDEKNFHVRAAVAGEAHIAQGGRLELQLVEADTGAIGGQPASSQKTVMRRTIRRLLPAASEEAAFPHSQIPKGSWCVRPVFIDRHGLRCHTEVVQDKLREPTPWFGSDEGVSRDVPAPWTPLKTSRTGRKLTVRCWGRQYEFAPRSLLDKAVATGKSLLAAPVRLSARVDGHRIRWKTSSVECLSKAPDQVVLSQKFSNKVLSLDVGAAIDFDGMMRIDACVSASRPVQITGLTLEIPLRTQAAKYYYQYRGRCGTDKAIGAVPRGGIKRSFRPYFWLGDEERGLAWFAESDENWFNADPSRVIEVSPEGSKTLLRIHLISKPVDIIPTDTPPPVVSDRRPPLRANLRYTFGLQATPVKPVESDAWDYRIFCLQQSTPGAGGKLQLPKRLLDKLEAAGVRTVAVFEHWTDIEAHTITTHQHALKKIVRDCHRRGMKVLLYFGFLFSERAPEWEDFGHSCLALPKTGWPAYNYPPQPVQTAWRVCLRSAWQDFVPWGIARAMDEFDADGVYLDGTASPYACRNRLHGCGTVRPDGSLGPTFPVFAVRSAMRRIYHIVKSRKPGGQVNVHNSANMVTPTVGWATSTWDGEQFAGFHKGTDLRDFLPLDTFRTEFMGHQWGIPAELLCYGKPMTVRQAWALALPHDVPVRPMLTPERHDLDLASAIWKAMDDFDRKEAEWLPYWRNRKYVSVSPDGACLSLYRHPKNGLLMILSNFHRKRTTFTVRFDLSRLGFGSHPLEAFDILTGKPLKVQNGQVKVSCPKMDFTLVRVRQEQV